jgi:hypothetical protein
MIGIHFLAEELDTEDKNYSADGLMDDNYSCQIGNVWQPDTAGGGNCPL